MLMKKHVLFFALMFAVTSFLTAQTVVFSDNFDSYTAGSHLAQVNSAWTTWTNAPGGSDDGVISNAQAYSAPNSLYIEEDIDQVYPFNSYTSGHYIIEFKLYIPSGTHNPSGPGAYFNVQHILRGQWALECYFDNDSTGYLLVGNSQHNFNYSYNTWIPVQMDLDLNNDQASLTINNNLIHSWPFHYTLSTTTGDNRLDAVNLCAGTVERKIFYVDDFVVTEVSAAQFGAFEVSPESMLLGVASNSTATEPIIMGNPGEGAINFRVVPTYDIPNPNPTSTEVTDLHYYQAQTPYQAINSFDGNSINLAIGIPSSALQSHIGKTLNEIDVYFSSSVANPKIRVYAMTDMLVQKGPGEVVYEQTFTPVDGWNHIQLTTPYLIDGSDLWFGIAYVETGIAGHIYLDGYTANEYSCWANNGNGWQNHFTGYDYNLMIGGKIDGTPIAPWINVDQPDGTIAPGGTVTDNITVNTNGMSLGETHTAKLHCYSNDPDNSAVVIPVTLTITTVSVNEHNQIEVSVYPNPAADYLQVNSEAIERVEIHNMSGQKVFDGFYGESHVVIPTDGMAPGTYVVTVTGNGTKTTKQVVIR